MSNPLANIAEDEIIIGAQAATLSPATIEVYGYLGLDFVWLDLEHKGTSSANSDSLANLVRAAESTGTTLMARPNSNDPHMIRKMLDTGLQTIVIPRIRTAAEVREAISAARFTYEGSPGDRGSSLSRASHWGQTPVNYAQEEDSEVIVGVLIENVDAVNNIDEILSVPELGFIRIGTGDLSVSAGHPMERNHPDVQELVNQVETACQEHTIPLSGKAHGLQESEQALEEGYQIITIGNDLSMIHDIVDERLDHVKNFQ